MGRPKGSKNKMKKVPCLNKEELQYELDRRGYVTWRSIGITVLVLALVAIFGGIIYSAVMAYQGVTEEVLQYQNSGREVPHKLAFAEDFLFCVIGLTIALPILGFTFWINNY